MASAETARGRAEGVGGEAACEHATGPRSQLQHLSERRVLPEARNEDA